MHQCRRRHVLTYITASSIGISGCSDWSENDELPQLNSLHVINIDQESQRFYLEVEFDSETIHSESHTIEGANGDTTGSMEIQKTWPDNPGDIFLYADVKGGGDDQLDLRDLGHGNHDIDLIIKSPTEVNFSLLQNST